MELDALNSALFARHTSAARTKERWQEGKNFVRWRWLVFALGVLGFYLSYVWWVPSPKWAGLTFVPSLLLTLWSLQSDKKDWALRCENRARDKVLELCTQLNAGSQSQQVTLSWILESSIEDVKQRCHENLMALAKDKLEYGDGIPLCTHKHWPQPHAQHAIQGLRAHLWHRENAVSQLVTDLRLFGLTDFKSAEEVYAQARAFVQR